MDNDQVVDQVAPEGQTTPTEQSPDVQSDGATSKASESSSETNFESLAAKKGFKTADDLAKAYANLESHSTKVAQKASDLEKTFFPGGEQPKADSRRFNSSETNEEQALAELDKFVNDRTSVEIQKVRAEFEEREQRRELRDVIKQYPDFGKYASEVKEVKGRYPNMPFEEAYQFAKLQKGDFQREASTEAIKFSSKQAQAQQQAQVAQTKPVKETNIGIKELLKNAASQVKINQYGKADPRSVAYFEQMEKELFGQTLDKTSSGL